LRILSGDQYVFLKQIMLKRSSKGQAISAEYLIALMVIIAAAAAMFTYIKRTFQARAYDAQKVAINDARTALGGKAVAMEYEPYYAVSSSDVDQSERDSVRFVNGGLFNQESNLERAIISDSVQLAPEQVK
jgi:uncharacterized protein (UPF0333 family)